MKASAVIISVLLVGIVVSLMSGLPLVQCGCCLWILLGGFLAVPLYQAFDKPSRTLTSGQGILLGFLVGVVAAVGVSILNYFIGATSIDEAMRTIRSNPDLGPVLAPAFDRFPEAFTQGAATLVGLVCNLVIYPLLGILGGVVGSALFKKSA